MKRIYIATNIHGRGVKHVAAFRGKADLMQYAHDYSRFCHPSATVDEICEALADHGIGFGSRSHRRVTLREARALVRNGAEAIDF